MSSLHIRQVMLADVHDLGLRDRLLRIARDRLPSTLGALLTVGHDSAHTIRLTRMPMRLKFNPRHYDDQTVAFLWACQLRTELLAAIPPGTASADDRPAHPSAPSTAHPDTRQPRPSHPDSSASSTDEHADLSLDAQQVVIHPEEPSGAPGRTTRTPLDMQLARWARNLLDVGVDAWRLVASGTEGAPDTDASAQRTIVPRNAAEADLIAFVVDRCAGLDPVWDRAARAGLSIWTARHGAPDLGSIESGRLPSSDGPTRTTHPAGAGRSVRDERELVRALLDRIGRGVLSKRVLESDALTDVLRVMVRTEHPSTPTDESPKSKVGALSTSKQADGPLPPVSEVDHERLIECARLVAHQEERDGSSDYGSSEERVFDALALLAALLIRRERRGAIPGEALQQAAKRAMGSAARSGSASFARALDEWFVARCPSRSDQPDQPGHSDQLDPSAGQSDLSDLFDQLDQSASQPDLSDLSTQLDQSSGQPDLSDQSDQLDPSAGEPDLSDQSDQLDPSAGEPDLSDLSDQLDPSAGQSDLSDQSDQSADHSVPDRSNQPGHPGDPQRRQGSPRVAVQHRPHAIDRESLIDQASALLVGGVIPAESDADSPILRRVVKALALLHVSESDWESNAPTWLDRPVIADIRRRVDAATRQTVHSGTGPNSTAPMAGDRMLDTVCDEALASLTDELSNASKHRARPISPASGPADPGLGLSAMIHGAFMPVEETAPHEASLHIERAGRRDLATVRGLLQNLMHRGALAPPGDGSFNCSRPWRMLLAALWRRERRSASPFLTPSESPLFDELLSELDTEPHEIDAFPALDSPDSRRVDSESDLDNAPVHVAPHQSETRVATNRPPDVPPASCAAADDPPFVHLLLSQILGDAGVPRRRMLALQLLSAYGLVEHPGRDDPIAFLRNQSSSIDTDDAPSIVRCREIWKEFERLSTGRTSSLPEEDAQTAQGRVAHALDNPAPSDSHRTQAGSPSTPDAHVSARPSRAPHPPETRPGTSILEGLAAVIDARIVDLSHASPVERSAITLQLLAAAGVLDPTSPVLDRSWTVPPFDLPPRVRTLLEPTLRKVWRDHDPLFVSDDASPPGAVNPGTEAEPGGRARIPGSLSEVPPSAESSPGSIGTGHQDSGPVPVPGAPGSAPSETEPGADGGTGARALSLPEADPNLRRRAPGHDAPAATINPPKTSSRDHASEQSPDDRPEGSPESGTTTDEGMRTDRTPDLREHQRPVGVELHIEDRDARVSEGVSQDTGPTSVKTTGAVTKREADTQGQTPGTSEPLGVDQSVSSSDDAHLPLAAQRDPASPSSAGAPGHPPVEKVSHTSPISPEPHRRSTPAPVGPSGRRTTSSEIPLEGPPASPPKADAQRPIETPTEGRTPDAPSAPVTAAARSGESAPVTISDLIVASADVRQARLADAIKRNELHTIFNTLSDDQRVVTAFALLGLTEWTTLRDAAACAAIATWVGDQAATESPAELEDSLGSPARRVFDEVRRLVWPGPTNEQLARLCEPASVGRPFVPSVAHDFLNALPQVESETTFEPAHASETGWPRVSEAGGLAFLHPFMGETFREALRKHALSEPDTIAFRASVLVCVIDPAMPGVLARDVLIRLLSGQDLDDPPVRIDPNLEDARVLASLLLRKFACAVPGLKTHSDEMLRAYYMRRPAKVEPRGPLPTYHLTLSRGPLDMLLDQARAKGTLPMGVTRLPWTPMLELAIDPEWTFQPNL